VLSGQTLSLECLSSAHRITMLSGPTLEVESKSGPSVIVDRRSDTDFFPGGNDG